MTSASELQALLRFLSQDAKVPLATAMGKAKDMRSAGLASPHDISKTSHETLQSIFLDPKLAKQILNAAKRVSKKRASSDASTETSASKKSRAVSKEEALQSPDAPDEASLTLPDSCTDEPLISQTTIQTNRAPLLLAFALTSLKYTMPSQPLSSRLSLAQAVVSANSRTKAASLGLVSGQSAEEEGWGEGYPVVKVMGREVRVMRRVGWGGECSGAQGEKKQQHEDEDTEEEVRGSADTQDSSQTVTASSDLDSDPGPSLWGVDLEALKQSNNPPPMRNKASPSSSHLPIHTPQSARTYLLKSFPSATPSSKKSSASASTSPSQPSNLSLLLGALDLLFQSWAHVLDAAELDKRAWAWYVRVRPEVQQGVAGWGGKGDVRLADTLALRRT